MTAAAAQHDPDVEAAMQAAYGVDPASLTLRRFWVLLRRLPPGRWPVQDHPASWSVEAHLLASVVDGEGV